MRTPTSPSSSINGQNWAGTDLLTERMNSSLAKGCGETVVNLASYEFLSKELNVRFDTKINRNTPTRPKFIDR
jgi:hypothetical protein